MHTNFTASSLLRSWIVLERGLFCFPVNVIIFTKQAALSWYAKDFFFLNAPNWSLSSRGFWILQLSQVLTSHPYTTVQWKCSTERYSLRSRQDSDCCLEKQGSWNVGSGPSWLDKAFLAHFCLLLSCISFPLSWGPRVDPGRMLGLPFGTQEVFSALDSVLVSCWPPADVVYLLLNWAFSPEHLSLGWWWPRKEHFLRLPWFSFK